MPSTHHLTVQNATTTTQPSTYHPNIPVPHLYDRVNDAYGPGVVAAWVLVALGIIAQRLAPLEGRLYRNLDKDLVATVMYPVCVAGDLIRHVRQFPGPNGPYWADADQDAEFGPYAVEIWASTQICLLAVGWNVMFMGLICRSRKRVIMIAIATLWIIGALFFAGWRENWFINITLGFTSMLCPFGIVAFILVSLTGAAYLLILDLAFIWQVLVRLVQRKFDGFLKLFVVMSAWIVFTALSALMIGISYYGMYWCLFPTSAHSVFEVFQLLALSVGVINLLFSMHGVVKIWGALSMEESRKVWARPMQILKTIPEEFRNPQARHLSIGIYIGTSSPCENGG